jgi:hypothetical protein
MTGRGLIERVNRYTRHQSKNIDAERQAESDRTDREMEKRKEQREKIAGDIVQRAEEGKSLTKSQQTFLDSVPGRIALQSELRRQGLNPAETYVNMLKLSVKDATEIDPETGKHVVERSDVRLKSRRHVTNELGKVMNIESSNDKPIQGTVNFYIHGDMVVTDPGHTEAIHTVPEADIIDAGSEVPPVQDS